MKPASRVVSPIPIVNKDNQQDGWFTSAGSIPFQLESAAEVRGGVIHAPRYFLTVIDGKLHYLHEDAPLYADEPSTIPVPG